MLYGSSNVHEVWILSDSRVCAAVGYSMKYHRRTVYTMGLLYFVVFLARNHNRVEQIFTWARITQTALLTASV